MIGKKTAAMQISIGLLLLVGWFAFATSPAYATEQNHTCQGGHNCNKGGSDGETITTSEATATAKSAAGAYSNSEGGSGGDGGQGGTGGNAQSNNAIGDTSATGGSSSNEGNNIDASDHSRVENNSSNVVLVPNNNTESCLRVWGISFGKDGTAGALGIPWRSKKCDYEQAADDAFAAGERGIGWFWKCENPSLYKSFRDKDETVDQAKADCLGRMLGEVTAMTTVTTLTEKLEMSEDLRRIERQKHQQLTEELSELCEESKDRIFAACTSK